MKPITYNITIKISLLCLAILAIISQIYTPIAQASNCDDVYSPISADIINAINRNKPDYIAVMDVTSVPWEMLAAIHYRETSFSRSNPNNGYGIFQFTPPPESYPPGPVSDGEFRRQLKYMADRLQNDYVWRNSLNPAQNLQTRKLTANETDINLIKNTLYSYNGRATVYSQQATNLGFSQPFEGSPYVMNRYDCQRARMGLITKDYGTIDGIDTRYGAFTLYSRLKGIFNSPYYGASNPPTLYYDQALTQEVYKMNGIYHLNPAQQAYLKVNSTNYGTGIWPKANTKLGTINPRDRISSIANNSWLSNVRMSGFTEPSDVANGNNANFVASITAPNTPGLYSEDLAVVVEGVSWVNGTNVSVPIAISANVNQPPRKDYLGPNEYLTPGQNVLSQDTHTVLHLSFNGKLELWVNYKKVWSSTNKDGIGGNRLINQPDGNIVLYKDNTPVWDSLTIGRTGNLVVQGDGNLVLNPLAAPPESISNTSTVNQGPILNSVLKSNDVLFPGQILYSQNGYYRLALQEDGNVVLYTPTRPIWASNTYMRKFDQLIVQNDGNIVSYDGYGFPVWSTGTFMSGGNTLIVQEDGNLVLYNPTRPVWSTNTFANR